MPSRRAASHTNGTYFAALYRRFAVRRGHNTAIFAVAHQILIIAYQMLLKGEDCKEQGGNYFDLQNKPRVVNRLVDRLASLGCGPLQHHAQTGPSRIAATANARCLSILPGRRNVGAWRRRRGARNDMKGLKHSLVPGCFRRVRDGIHAGPLGTPGHSWHGRDTFQFRSPGQYYFRRSCGLFRDTALHFSPLSRSKALHQIRA